MAHPNDFSIQTSLGRIAARRWTSGKKPVLALHGWLDNLESLSELIEKLEGFDVCAIDFPGHGESEHLPGNQPYHFFDLPLLLHEVIEKLEWKSCCILGHSMGGAAACLFAAAFPEKVERLALIEALGPLTGPANESTKRMKEFISRYTTLSRKAEATYPSFDIMVKLRLQVNQMAESSAKKILARNSRETEKGFMWKTDRRLTLPSGVRLTEDQVHDYLSSIECPVLLIKSSESLLTQLPGFESRVKSVKDIQVVEVPGHHHVQTDSPNLLQPHIQHFLV